MIFFQNKLLGEESAVLAFFRDRVVLEIIILIVENQSFGNNKQSFQFRSLNLNLQPDQISMLQPVIICVESVMGKHLRKIEVLEDELDELQSAYLVTEDDTEQMRLESKFMRLLMEATQIDGRDRVAANVTITNWTRE